MSIETLLQRIKDALNMNRFEEAKAYLRLLASFIPSAVHISYERKVLALQQIAEWEHILMSVTETA